jgi:hypothetical protein
LKEIKVRELGSTQPLKEIKSENWAQHNPEGIKSHGTGLDTTLDRPVSWRSKHTL